MPSTTGTGPPVISLRPTSNGTASITPDSAYTRCPVLRYRPYEPPSTSTFRSPVASDCTTICPLSHESVVFFSENRMDRPPGNSCGDDAIWSDRNAATDCGVPPFGDTRRMLLPTEKTMLDS